MNNDIKPSRDRWSMEYRYKDRVLRPYAALRSFLVTDERGKVLYDGTNIHRAADAFGNAAIKEIFMKNEQPSHEFRQGRKVRYLGRVHEVLEVFDNRGTPHASWLTIRLIERVEPNQLPREYTMSFARAFEDLEAVAEDFEDEK